MESLKLPTLGEASYETIKEQILSGKVRPGEKINLDHYASLLGVSATPIREALSKLQQEGLAQYIPRAGWRVPELSKAEYAKHRELQVLFETTLAVKAMPFVEEEKLGKLRELNDKLLEIDSVESEQKGRKLLDADGEFHMAIYRCYSNNIMIDNLSHVWNATKYLRNMVVSQPDYVERFHPAHEAIISALESKDKDALKKAMDEHFHRAADMIDRIFTPLEVAEA